MTTYTLSLPEGGTTMHLLLGLVLGLILSAVLIGFDRLFNRFSLRSFNVTVIGLFVGYLMGQALVLIFDVILDLSPSSFSANHQSIEVIKISLFLFGTYLGTVMTLRSSDELYISIPFVKFSPTAHKKRDLLVDLSLLSDPRILDLCTTGLFDQHLVIPKFLMKELQTQAETGDEEHADRARQSLEVVKKLEEQPQLQLRFNSTDFAELLSLENKSLRLARLLEANILVSGINRVKYSRSEGVRIIDLHSLSKALKPLVEKGESMKIKVQRHGKELRQGVGYLEDGAMVVINGGGAFIGETIDVHVLSVKHTNSGRIIFCNAKEEPQDNPHSGTKGKPPATL